MYPDQFNVQDLKTLVLVSHIKRFFPVPPIYSRYPCITLLSFTVKYFKN